MGPLPIPATSPIPIAPTSIPRCGHRNRQGVLWFHWGLNDPCGCIASLAARTELRGTDEPLPAARNDSRAPGDFSAEAPAWDQAFAAIAEMALTKHPSYLRFWGKQRGAIEGGANWHAAAYHCLDVAASAHALLEANDLLRRQLAELLAIPEQQLVDLMTFWMAPPVLNQRPSPGGHPATSRKALRRPTRTAAMVLLPVSPPIKVPILSFDYDAGP